MCQLRLDQLHYNYITLSQLQLQKQLHPITVASVIVTITKPTITNTGIMTLSLY